MSNTEDNQLLTEISALGAHPIATICKNMMDGVPEVTKWLKADPEKLHENTRHRAENGWKQTQVIIDQMKKENQGALRSVQSQARIDKRQEVLAVLARRLRKLGRQRRALRLVTSLIFFAVLFLAVLVIHSKIAYFSEHLGISELWAFVLLAAVMLPVDLARARLEHHFEEKLKAQEREDAANAYAELVRISVETLIEVAKAYP